MANLGNMSIADLRLGATQVKAAYLGSQRVWGGEEPVPVTGDWLCFTAEQENSNVRLYKNGSPADIYLETSTDGNAWTDYSWSGSAGDVVTLANVGDKVYFRAKSENQTIGSSNYNYYKFLMNGQIAASGNIQTLLKADGSVMDLSGKNYCFFRLFFECTSLTRPPALPATTLASYCYAQLFEGCTALTSAPVLPAMALDTYCYWHMFQYCASLTQAPALPADVLAAGCYHNMFHSCTSLTQAPALPATTLASYCYAWMFDSCSSLSAVEVGFTSWTGFTDSTTGWLDGVASSGTFTCPSVLPDTRGSGYIPNNWTKVDVA